jgi:hypothetical protein
MLYKQPTTDIKWVPKDQIPTDMQILNMTEEQDVGFFFDADISYPPSLHRLHSSYPVAPYNATITEDMLSPYAQECHEMLNGKVKYKAKKLCTTFATRTHYGIHYLNMKTLLQLGLKIVKIRRCLSFKQTAFLRTYIEKCSLLRQKADTEFGRRLFKLFANSVFGKFLEQTRDYTTVALCTTEKKLRKSVSSPLFKSTKIISNDLVAVFSKTKTVNLNKAFLVGCSILDISKNWMMRSYYFKIVPLLRPLRVSVAFTDTGTSIYIIHIFNSYSLSLIHLYR